MFVAQKDKNWKRSNLYTESFTKKYTTYVRHIVGGCLWIYRVIIRQILILAHFKWLCSYLGFVICRYSYGKIISFAQRNWPFTFGSRISLIRIVYHQRAITKYVFWKVCSSISVMLTLQECLCVLTKNRIPLLSLPHYILCGKKEAIYIKIQKSLEN